MLSATYLRGPSDETGGEKESAAKKIFKDCITKEDPVMCAAQGGAYLACSTVTGPYVAGLCALGAGAVWNALFGPNCEEQDGTRWYTHVCHKMKSGDGTGVIKCADLRPIKPIRASQYTGNRCTSPAGVRSLMKGEPCAMKSYCQLPGMPPPVPEEIPAYDAAQDLIRRTRPTMHASAGVYFDPPVIQQYPTGTIATQQPNGRWSVALPKQALSGEGDYEVLTEVVDDPTKKGARAVSNWRFEYLTGVRSWYATPPAWIGLGLLGAAVAGGIWYKRTR